MGDFEADNIEISNSLRTEFAEFDKGEFLTEYRSASSLVAPLLGFLAAVIFYLLIHFLVSPGTYLHRIFLPSGGLITTTVPFLTTAIFFWAVIQIIKIQMQLMSERVCLREKFMIQSPYMIQKKGVQAVLSSFNKALNPQQTWVFKRIYGLLVHLDLTRDVQQSHELLRHQMEIDTDRFAARYTVVNVLVWAMPILGFIGTVLGISFAMDDFSTFLRSSGQQVEIGMIREQLSNIATGLAFAFDTTLLGLVTSLITMFFLSVAQSQNEQLLIEMEALGLKIISYFLPEKTSEERIASSLRELLVEIRQLSRNLCDAKSIQKD